MQIGTVKKRDKKLKNEKLFMVEWLEFGRQNFWSIKDWIDCYLIILSNLINFWTLIEIGGGGGGAENKNYMA
jgi:hypothetical protein